MAWLHFYVSHKLCPFLLAGIVAGIQIFSLRVLLSAAFVLYRIGTFIQAKEIAIGERFAYTTLDPES